MAAAGDSDPIYRGAADGDAGGGTLSSVAGAEKLLERFGADPDAALPCLDSGMPEKGPAWMWLHYIWGTTTASGLAKRTGDAFIHSPKARFDDFCKFAGVEADGTPWEHKEGGSYNFLPVLRGWLLEEIIRMVTELKTGFACPPWVMLSP